MGGETAASERERRKGTWWSQRSHASAMTGSSEASSSFVMLSVRRRCCLSSGAQENDSRSVDANVCPPMRFVCGNGGSWGIGMGCMSCTTGGYCPSPCLYPPSSTPIISPPISSPSSRILRSLIIRRCFRCRSRAAARTRSRRAISSRVISPGAISDACGCGCCGWGGAGGCGACCCCCWWWWWWLPSAPYTMMPTTALLSRSRLRRCRSAAFSRLTLWLSVSPSRDRFREVDPVGVCRSLSIQFFYYLVRCLIPGVTSQRLQQVSSDNIVTVSDGRCWLSCHTRHTYPPSSAWEHCVTWHYIYFLSMLSRPGPTPIHSTGTPTCASMNSTYFLQFSGSSS